MDENGKIKFIADILEIEPTSIDAGSFLLDIPEWDSLTALSFLVSVHDELGVKLSGNTVRKFLTIGDMMAAMP